MVSLKKDIPNHCLNIVFIFSPYSNCNSVAIPIFDTHASWPFERSCRVLVSMSKVQHPVLPRRVTFFLVNNVTHM